MCCIQNKPLRGFDDLDTEYCEKAEYVTEILKKLSKKFAMKEVSLPILERLSLFRRGVGETTDIISKEMFFFKRKEEEICLRPEMTTSFIRYCFNSNLFEGRYFYLDWCFRAERPQKGRRRQFRQFGVEIIGDTSIFPELDSIEFLWTFFKKVGLEVLFKINSIGSIQDRAQYEVILYNYFLKNKRELSEDSLEKLKKRKCLKILDSKDCGDIIICKNAPCLKNYISGESEKKIKTIENFMKQESIKYELSSTLVRGLDYYNDFVFEVESLSSDAAQNSLVGGGRYDKLASVLNNKREISAFGFGIGFDRVVQLIAPQKEILIKVIIGFLIEEEEIFTEKIAQKIRKQNIIVNIKKDVILNTIFYATKNGYKYLVVIGKEIKEDYVLIKNLETKLQEKVLIKNLEKFLFS